MKTKPLFLFLALCLFLFGCGGRPKSRYADYSEGSGFDRTQIDSATLENLEVLGRVWGFVKYHHPALVDSICEIDYELFELLPQVADATPVERNRVLLEWIDGFTDYKITPYLTVVNSEFLAEHQTNLGWIRDTTLLGRELSERLAQLRFAIREGNYYVAATPSADNPEFTHEKSYAGLSNPDYGYRLLSVFRFWNMVEYFFPSKYLTDKDWNDVLPEYIGRMVHPVEGDYRKEAHRMIAELDDNHAQMGNRTLFGDYRVPLHVGFVEDRLIVITPDTVSNPVFVRIAAFEVGDQIVAVDGKPVAHYIAQTREFVPCSNENDVLFATADLVLRSKTNRMLPLRYRRNGIERDTLVHMVWMSRFEGMYLYERIEAYKSLDDGIGYIYPAKYEGENISSIDSLVKNTQGLVIDLRCYPATTFIDFMEKHIVPHSDEKPFQAISPEIALPGIFYSMPYAWSTSTGDKYPGAIVVLVDERTQSFAECCVQWMQSNPRVVTIGSQSAGANGNVSFFTLPGSIKSCFSGLGWGYPDGWMVNRQGVKIDLEVRPTIHGIKAGRDELLEKAIEIIGKGSRKQVK